VEIVDNGWKRVCCLYCTNNGGAWLVYVLLGLRTCEDEII
jgi:hypothetical protein